MTRFKIKHLVAYLFFFVLLTRLIHPVEAAHVQAFTIKRMCLGNSSPTMQLYFLFILFNFNSYVRKDSTNQV